MIFATARVFPVLTRSRLTAKPVLLRWSAIPVSARHSPTERREIMFFFVAEFLESWMGGQGISDRSEFHKERRNEEQDCKSQGPNVAAPRCPETSRD